MKEAFREDYCNRLVKCLTSAQYQEISSVLKQFLNLLNSGDYELSLPDTVLEVLLQTVVSNQRKLAWPVQLLCSLALHLILSGTAHSGVYLPQKQIQESAVVYGLPLLLIQGKNLEELVPQLIRWVCTVGYSCEVQGHSLSAAVTLARQQTQLFTTEHVHILSVQLADWLKQVGLQQAPNPYSRSFFKKASEQQPLVTECDGMACRSFFTALCIGKYYTSDQLLNIQSFSVLRQWLYATHLQDRSCAVRTPSVGVPFSLRGTPISMQTSDSYRKSDSGSVGKTIDTPLRKNRFSSTTAQPPEMPDLPTPPVAIHPRASSSSSQPVAADEADSDSSSASSLFREAGNKPSPLSMSIADVDDSFSVCDSELGQGEGTPSTPSKEHSLLNAALQYSLRIIKQADRKAKTTTDQELQHAALLEALCMLDSICCCETSFVKKSVDSVMKLTGRSQPNKPRVSLAILQFLIHHGESAGQDYRPHLHHYLDTIIASHYGRPGTAFDTVIFLEDNLQFLWHSTDFLGKYFPNILKILAWNPRCFVGNFATILPACITNITAVELLHCLLDLPCLTAALQLYRDQSGSSTLLSDPAYTPLFNFILRTQSGRGDTINRPNTLHRVLEGSVNHHCIQICADTVPHLLRVYFKTVEDIGDFELCGKLLPVLIERSGLLYNIPGFKEEVERELSNAIVAMCQQQPGLVVSQHAELLDHLSTAKNMEGRQPFFTSLIWAVGEYLSPNLDSRCTPDLVSKMYEALETLAYELTGQSHSEKQSKASPRLITSLMSTLAKLASRSQDLIPRAVLCIGRLGQSHQTEYGSAQVTTILRDRANELTSILKQPNVAALILSPPAEINSGRWHTDTNSLPLLLRTAANILQGQ